MAGIVFAKFTTPTSRAETIIFRWGGDWILWYFRYLRHSVSARMLWSPCEMELYIWSWEWQTSGSSGGTIKSWARILELNNFDIDVHCFHNVLKNTYCVFKHNLANPTTHQLLILRTNIPISCLLTVSSVLIDFKCESNIIDPLIRWKTLVVSSKYCVERHRFTSMSQLSNTREFISNLDFRQLCQIYCFISFDFFPHRLFNCLRFSEQQHFLREVMIIREIVLIV